MRIVIADDHPLFRQALVEIIRNLHISVELIECESIYELRAVLGRVVPDLILLDLSCRTVKDLTVF